MEIEINGKKIAFEEPTWGQILEYIDKIDQLITNKGKKLDVTRMNLEILCELSNGMLSKDDLIKLKKSDISKLLSLFDELYDYESKKKE